MVDGSPVLLTFNDTNGKQWCKRDEEGDGEEERNLRPLAYPQVVSILL